MTAEGAPAALDDLRVLDLTDRLGQYCGRLLASFGADVIRIEPPDGGAPRRAHPLAEGLPESDASLEFWFHNLNKRSVVLDLDSDEGRAALAGLAAGADVLLEGPGEAFLRSHSDQGPDLPCTLRSLACRYDLVLVEGHKTAPLSKVWLRGEDDAPPPPEVPDVIASIPRAGDPAEAVMRILDEWLPRQWLKTPVYGCVLANGAAGVERTAALLAQVAGCGGRAGPRLERGQRAGAGVCQVRRRAHWLADRCERWCRRCLGHPTDRRRGR